MTLMPIGAYQSILIKHWPLKAAIVRTVGTVDLHTHYRLRPLLDYIEQSAWPRKNTVSALELGCGNGITLFELNQRISNLVALGCDIDRESIQAAEKAKIQLHADNLHFEVTDGTSLELPTGTDLVLLVDFLEHIPGARALLNDISPILHDGGEILISVPTPRYPTVFGRDFHRSVGHRVDGYTLEGLNSIMPRGLKLTYYKYSTGFLASTLCALYYRWLIKVRVKFLGLFLRLLPHLLTRWDPLSNAKSACSLFAVYGKIA